MRPPAADPDAATLVDGDYSEASGYRAASKLLAAKRHRPTAIICANDMMAIGAIRCCRERGLAVPADVSITGFDDIPGAELLDPPLTTVSQPGFDMGAAAAELLLHQIGVVARPPKRSTFATTFMKRKSVARRG